jgi:hypothetical protein
VYETSLPLTNIAQWIWRHGPFNSMAVGPSWGRHETPVLHVLCSTGLETFAMNTGSLLRHTDLPGDPSCMDVSYATNTLAVFFRFFGSRGT